MRTTAPTQEIPKEEWQAYFATLAEQHSGWATTVEILHREVGDQRVMDGLPFQGMSYDRAGSQAGDILIEAGDAGTPFETHLVHRPVAVWIALTQPGAEADVEISSDEGYTTLVRLQPRRALPA
jgi:hypothetical protein